ncbi:CTP-dependent riboflavin kinase [Candidatus Micrarchaeota archaeon]|nr:CTP-dependent riboflavin kinase [Candidatus Micrarchaeota archaeon]
MDEMLILLLRRGAHSKALRLTTAELGSLAGMSQQNASRKLARLAEEGYVERGREGIRLTKKAYDESAALFSSLKAVFEGTRMEMEGTIVRGLGEGSFYMSLPGYRRQIREKLGFDPFPGTLNIRLDSEQAWKRQQLLDSEPIIIPGFRDKDRTYGDLFAFRCRVGGREGAVIVPLRTHHGPDILEAIFSFNAKKELGMADGERVKVVI